MRYSGFSKGYGLRCFSDPPPDPSRLRRMRFTYKSEHARGFGPTPNPSLNQGGELFALKTNKLIQYFAKA